jgi:flagellar protein FliO/FliZ
MKAANFAPLLWLMLVLVLIPLVLLALKRSGLAARLGADRGRAPGAGLALRDSLVIGPNQRVVTLEVGQGDQRRWLVLGVTPQQITPLHTLMPPPDSVPMRGDAATVGATVGADHASLRPSFEAMLARVRGTAARRTGASS